MIDVQYFASVRERLGTDAEQVDAAGVSTVAALLELLVARHGDKGRRVLQESRVLVAVNQVVAGPHAAVRSGDEVAFFPPVTGG
ncbi:MAG: molybdopterin converting factor subunit 1 [Pseudohongiellaceae bacterium]|jgi:molybdopterin synthase sulfur carrier subunit